MLKTRFVELALAIRYLKPKRSFLSTITVLSALGIILGVSILIIVLSVMEGFERELRNKVIGFNSHLTFTTTSGIITNPSEIMAELRKHPEVVAVSPFMAGPVLVNFQGKITTPFIKGIDPETSESVVPMKQCIYSGDWEFGPDAVIVGDEWARKNGAKVGDKLLLYSPRNLQSALADPKKIDRSAYLPGEYTITGVFMTGRYEYDMNFLLVSLSEAQRLYSLGNYVQGIAIKIRNPDHAEVVKTDLNSKFRLPYRALTWMDQNRQLFSAIAVERRLMFFILVFIIIVASFCICTTTLTLTIQKSRQIGIMKALGARNSQIVSIFTLYGFVLGAVGAFIGVASGLLIVAYRNLLSNWLARTFSFEAFPASVYNFYEIPAIVDPTMILIISAVAVLFSTLAAFVPAWLAARFDPVETLRGDA